MWLLDANPQKNGTNRQPPRNARQSGRSAQAAHLRRGGGQDGWAVPCDGPQTALPEGHLSIQNASRSQRVGMETHDGGGQEEVPRPPRAEDLTGLCAELNRFGARYVVVGGFAIIFHGFQRLTN